jgi:hypothetical protein
MLTIRGFTGLQANTPPTINLRNSSGGRQALSWLAILLFTLALLWLANLVAFRLHPGVYHIDVGTFRGGFWVKNAHAIEQADGRTYRWTRALTTLELVGIQSREHMVVQIASGPRPAPASIELRLNGTPWTHMPVAGWPRTAHLLLPPDAPHHTAIELVSPTFRGPDDERELGFMLDAFSLHALGATPIVPGLELLLVQVGLLSAVQLIVVRIGGRWPVQLLLGSLVAVASAGIQVFLLPLSFVFLLSLAIAAAILALATWLVLPHLTQTLSWAGDQGQIRILWALMLVAIAIRLIGVLHPTFNGQDIGIQLARLNMALNGQHVIIDPSHEFGGGRTIHPTGLYIAVLPLLAVIDDRAVAVQSLVATLDGITALFVGLLALRLGGSQTAARLAVVLYAGSLTAFAVLTYSFSAQIFGQWFTAPVLLLMSRPGALDQPRTWLLASFALAFAIFTHIGVAILAGAWFGLLVIMMLLLRRDSPALGASLASFVILMLSAFVLLYSYVVVEMVVSLAARLATGGAETGPLLKGATGLLWKALFLAFTEIGMLLLPLALLRFFADPPTRDARLAVSAMLGAALVFFLVDIVFYLQVRYLYFMLPLALALIARLLGELAARGRAGYIMAWNLVIALSFVTITLWYGATWGSSRITMVMLTH